VRTFLNPTPTGGSLEHPRVTSHSCGQHHFRSCGRDSRGRADAPPAIPRTAPNVLSLKFLRRRNIRETAFKKLTPWSRGLGSGLLSRRELFA
jgi:hypothetical protein